MRSVFYSKDEMNIVGSGLEAIATVLQSNDYAVKERFLLCLDKYLDPWFGYQLSFEKEIYAILEKELFEANPFEVKQDIIQLLDFCCSYPLDFLKENKDNLEQELQIEIQCLFELE